MREDENTISQDDSGLIRAGRLIAYANKVDKPVNTVGYVEFDNWIQDNNLRFGVSSIDEMRTLKADIVNGEYDVDEVREIYEGMFGEDPGGKSIAQKTGNHSEFTDSKGEYGVFGDDYDYETEDEDEEEDDEDELGSDDEEGTQAVDKEFSLDVYRVLPEEQGEDFDGNMLGFAVDFPNSDVYVEWNNKIFPDPLDDGHVSIYSSLEDLTTATGNETELVETISQPDSIEKQSLEGYPSLPPDDAAPEAKEFVRRMEEEGHDDNEALLYQLLGSGTPEWKMSKEDAGYKDEPEENMVCSNCQYYYVGTDGEAVCSKVRGEVFPEHWCELWEPGDDTDVSKSESFIPLNINGESLLVEEADTQEKRYTGLSKYESLDDIDGMLFRYPSSEAHRLVWRDMSFPVDVIHLDRSSEVVATGSLEGPGDFVQAMSKTALEVPHGFVSDNNIQKGDVIDFRNSVSKSLFKNGDWIPYVGPEGGEGWRNVSSGEIAYQTEPPGGINTDVLSPRDIEDNMDLFTDNQVQALREAGYEVGDDSVSREESIQQIEDATGASVSVDDTVDDDVVGVVQDVVDNVGVDVEDIQMGDEESNSYDYTNQSLSVDSGHFDEEMIQERFENGEFAGSSKYYTVIHEIGHAAHRNNMEDKPTSFYDDIVGSEETQSQIEQREEVKEYVSEYAAQTPMETVAEIFAGSLHGEEYPDEIWELYFELGGPDIRDVEVDL